MLGGMPTTHHLNDVDIDTAMLHDPLTFEQLDQLDTVLDARDALADATEYIAYAQAQIEAGTFDLAMQDRVGADLLKLADAIKAAAIAING